MSSYFPPPSEEDMSDYTLKRDWFSTLVDWAPWAAALTVLGLVVYGAWQLAG